MLVTNPAGASVRLPKLPDDLFPAMKRLPLHQKQRKRCRRRLAAVTYPLRCVERHPARTPLPLLQRREVRELSAGSRAALLAMASVAILLQQQVTAGNPDALAKARRWANVGNRRAVRPRERGAILPQRSELAVPTDHPVLAAAKAAAEVRTGHLERARGGMRGEWGGKSRERKNYCFEHHLRGIDRLLRRSGE